MNPQKHWRVKIISEDQYSDRTWENTIWFVDREDAERCYRYYKDLPNIGDVQLPLPPKLCSLRTKNAVIHERGEWQP